MEEHYHRLIIEYFEKTISDDGLTQLQDWIELQPENLAQFSDTIHILEAARASLKHADHSKKTWEKISAHIAQQQNQPQTPVAVIRPIKRNWLAYAASLLIVCATSWLSYKSIFNKPAATDAMEIASNPNGKRSKLMLPDGSVAYLAGGSTLRYAKNFDGNKRELYLSGEAFFDVVHRTDKPFVVKSGEISTVVLGTSFNVKAYGADNKITITVNTGKVGVMANTDGKTELVKYLTPNEQISINTKTGVFAFGNANAADASAWISNNLVFYNTTLKDIAAALEHQYGVKIDFTDADLGAVRLTTRLMNMPLEQAMENLTALSGLAYTQTGKHLFISNTNERGGRIMK
ncbi:FecR domain-containing protein [Mucilaginibacter sp.]|uniref:FecR family protein n=1 Tax=Mucilaginibacter sp. TaxID=1882438 RepID=UPI0032675B26